MGHRGFWRELKRRHVYRVAAVYAIVGWLLIQVATQVFPVFHLPDWIDQAVVLLILLGFPIALVLAWAFDATPQGIVRTDRRTGLEDGADSRAQAHRAGVAVGLIGLLIAALAGIGWWRVQYGGTHPMDGAPTASMPVVRAGASAPPPPAGASSTPAISAKSVAVLPFANESGDKDQQYFSDGLSEELITALSQFAGLKVINRDSSFQFRNSSDSVQTIARTLGVAHLLEGSVQRAGDEVRISAELVNAADGSTLWSQQYDRPYKDVFALQDDITKSVAAALKAKLLDSGSGAVVQSDRPPSGNLAAWNAYLKGQAYYQHASEADLPKAVAQFAEAVRLDPDYAAAYAAASQAWTHLAAYYLGGDAQRHAYAEARAAVDQALQLNPDLAAAHDARGILLQWADFDWNGAESEFRRALQLAPNDGTAKFGLALQLGAFGHPLQAVALLRQMLTIDPRDGGTYGVLGRNLAAAGSLEEAEQVARTSIALLAGQGHVYGSLAIILIQGGDAKAALAAAQREPDPPMRDFAVAMALQAAGDRAASDMALQQLIARHADTSAYQIADVYAFRRDPGNMFKWLDRAWANRDPGIQVLLTDPFILRYKDDPRFAAFCKKVGLPTTTDAKAQP